MSKISDADRLRVLMIATNYPSDYDPVSGIFYRDHARAIALYDDVTVLCSYSCSEQWFRIRQFFKIKNETESNVRTIRVEFLRLSNKIDALVSAVLILFVGLKLKRNDGFDLIHAQKLFPAGGIAFILSRLLKIPMIVTEHSDYFPHVIRNKIRRLTVQYVVKKAEVLIAVSNAMKRDIINSGIGSTIEKIYNPVNVQKFLKSEIYSFKGPVKNILHVSTFQHPRKGIDYLLQAVARLKQIRSDFILHMSGGGSLIRSKFEAMAQSLSLGTNIIFHGTLPDPRLVTQMQKCQFFVLPSLSEGFGVVLIEAMACGKPVIATNCGGPEEIVTEETGILVPPGNVEALTNALDYMLDHYHQYDPEVIRKYVIHNFSYEVIGQEIDDSYRKVLQG